MSGAEPEEFFPPRFWGLDPLFSAKVKLNIRDVLSLASYPEFPGVYCVGNHPVLGVHVMGDVVSVKEKSSLIAYEVDDGSGVLSCTQWRRSEDSSEGLYVPSIGQLVSVFGRVEEYRAEKQLRVSAIVPEEDPNAEPVHWLEVEQAKRQVHCQHFSLPHGVVQPAQQHPKKRPVKEVVREKVMEFLKSRSSTPFTLSSLSASGGEVMSAVWECVSMRERERDGEEGSVSKGEVAGELNALVKSLPKSGVVVHVPVNSTALKLEVHYELLSEEKHLFPVILDFMKRKLQIPSTRASQLGVPRDWIVQHVRGRETLQHVPVATVTTAISHLEDASRIFSVSDRAYKTVN